MGVTAEFTVGCTDALTAVATTMVPILLRTTTVLRTIMGGGTGIIDPSALCDNVELRAGSVAPSSVAFTPA